MWNRFTFIICWVLPFLLVLVSCDPNPKVTEITEEIDRVEEERLLGQLLFHERRLSKDNTVSCAACHLAHLAFTDGVPKSKGIEGKTAFRNAPTLFNMKDQPLFMFDGVIKTLEIQALSPIHDENEMGSSIEEILSKLKEDKVYKKQVHKAYGRDLDAKAITQSLAAFQRTLISTSSPYDLYLKDNKKYPLSADELAGLNLFTEKFNCVSCHSGKHFTNGTPESNGIHLTKDDWGKYRATGKDEDKGKFKVPSLRNIAVTHPYMHDGRFETLEEVLKFYAGKKESHGAEIVQKYTITPKEQQQIIAFLNKLTDTSLIVHED
jgi:cytochrome c peroxidase